MLHTIEPSVTYEYVPSTNQSQITQIDQVDDLPMKNLMTYAIRNRLLEQAGSSSFNWLDFTMAQSYHMGGVQTSARRTSHLASLRWSGRRRNRCSLRRCPLRGRNFPISGCGP